MLRRPRELWKRYCKSTWKSGRPGGGLDRTVSGWDTQYRRGGKALRWQWRSVGMVKICSNLVLTHLLEPKMAASCLAAPKFRHITKHRWNYYPVQHQAQAWTIYHQMFTVSAIPTPTTGAAVNDWVDQASKCLTKRLITKLSIEYTSGHTLVRYTISDHDVLSKFWRLYFDLYHLEISSDPYANLITEPYTS